MKYKFVIRLLTEAGELLAWGEEHLKPVASREEGVSRFGGKGHRTMLRVQKAGTATFVAVHWCDLDVARKIPILGGPMVVPETAIGGNAAFDWMQAIWGVQGNVNVPLPPVSVGTVVLTPPTGGIGAASQ